MRGPEEAVRKRGTIGRRLVERGAITADQLDRAIEAQVIFGGRLGTSLLELGFVDENTLNVALSEKLGVPTLGEGVTDPMPTYEALQVVSLDLVRAYRVLPFRIEGKRLHVLMEDPSNLRQLDDLAFRTGFIIIPYVVAEARLAFLLERYFKIRRESRYLQLLPDGSEIGRPALHESPEVAAASTSMEETQWSLDGRAGGMRGRAVQAAPPGDDLLPEDLHRRLIATPIRQRQLRETSEAPAPEAQPAPASVPNRKAAPPVVKSAAGRGRPLPMTLDEAMRRLAAAEERDGVAETLLAFAKGRCRRAALFILQRNVFLGWDAAGAGVNADIVRALRFSAEVPSALQAACGARSYLVYPVTDYDGAVVHVPLLAALGGGAPAAALIIPISVRDRIVNVFYADNGPGGAPPRDVSGFLALTAAVPHAFARLLRKRKAMVT